MIDRAKNVRVTPYDTETEMISSTYGTAELQGDASPSPPKPYMSRVAKIALALGHECSGRFRHLARECVEGYGIERRGG